MTVDQVNKLRALCLAITSGDLRRPWSVQTSNSFRRIGTDRADGDVLCATIQRSDGHPDLHAAPGVLDYIVAAHPTVVLELIEQRDNAWRALDHLSRKIAGHDEVFAEAGALRLGGVPSTKSATTYATSARAIPAAPPLDLPPLGQADRERAEKAEASYQAFLGARSHSGKGRARLDELLGPDSTNFLGTGLTMREFTQLGHAEKLTGAWAHQSREERRRRLDAVMRLSIELARVRESTEFATRLAEMAIESVIEGDWSMVEEWAEHFTFEDERPELREKQAAIFAIFRELLLQALRAAKGVPA